MASKTPENLWTHSKRSSIRGIHDRRQLFGISKIHVRSRHESAWFSVRRRHYDVQSSPAKVAPPSFGAQGIYSFGILVPIQHLAGSLLGESAGRSNQSLAGFCSLCFWNLLAFFFFFLWKLLYVFFPREIFLFILMFISGGFGDAWTQSMIP